MSIKFTTAKTEDHLRQILDLQKQNHKSNVSDEIKQKEGYVTVKHDLSTLKSISGSFHHVIGLDGERVVSYALTMVREARDSVPVLVPMFEEFDKIQFDGKSVRNENYVAMGQVCIDESYRGQGILRCMYEYMQLYLSPHFDLFLTDIDTKNTKSINAHNAVGWQNVAQYQVDDVQWQIVGIWL